MGVFFLPGTLCLKHPEMHYEAEKFPWTRPWEV
jgi:hypothetical protein